MADFRTAVGKARLHTADLSEPPKISDEIMEGYLALHGWAETDPTAFTDRMVWRAAADALDAMSTSELLESKKIRTQDLTVDGPAVAAELRKKAAQLRAQADEADAAEGGFFDLIPNGWAPGAEGVEARW